MFLRKILRGYIATGLWVGWALVHPLNEGANIFENDNEKHRRRFRVLVHYRRLLPRVC